MPLVYGRIQTSYHPRLFMHLVKISLLQRVPDDSARKMAQTVHHRARKGGQEMTATMMRWRWTKIRAQLLLLRRMACLWTLQLSQSGLPRISSHSAVLSSHG